MESASISKVPFSASHPPCSHNGLTASYLADLRNNRVARPSGARPLPSQVSGRRESFQAVPESAPEDDRPARAESIVSHQRAQSVMSNMSISSRTSRSLVQPPNPSLVARAFSPAAPITPLKPSMVVPSATYIERGQRWMEKEEAYSLGEALRDMDIAEAQAEEARLHSAAQEEASELVWQHQHPGAIKPEGTPYKYKEHLRKNSYAHARTESVGRHSGVGIATGLARDIAPRSVSGGSSNSGGMLSQSRVSSGASKFSHLSSTQNGRHSLDQGRQRLAEEMAIDASTDARVISTIKKPYHGLSKTVGAASGRRRTSGKRNISGELAGTFTADQIWEEPLVMDIPQVQSADTGDMPAPLRLKPRNPLNRVQFEQEPPRSNSTPPEPTKKFSRYEIHQNPPTQSRNPAYMANTPPPVPQKNEISEVPVRDGLEIRSEDIRLATSMKMKDRSPKLPTPTVVSDKPGRPIVSFNADWEPKEADLKPVEEQRRQRPTLAGRFGATNQTTQSLPVVPHSKNFPPTSVPTILFPNAAPIQVNRATMASVPSINLPDTPSIQFNDSQPVPTINFPDTPSIQVNGPSHPIPILNFPDVPQISVSGPAAIPSISVSDESAPSSRSARPLPDPKTASSRPIPRHHATAPLPRGHWSPAPGNRATATCHQCELPIEGRVVALRGLSQRFHPGCFICYTCGTGLEALEISPEPSDRRNERLDRIERRAKGEHLEEIDGQTMADDGDERLRFYCHLDWHELYAPRCKHCTTPIIGEHAVALGEHWHYGHFFCAECGDPFEQGMTHIEKDGYAWCLSCQTKRTERRAPKCMKCKKAVIGQYVEALGGEFHDECFKCATCLGGFDDGQIFPKDDGSVLCTGCMERKLKA
jgi:hypothetical protein